MTCPVPPGNEHFPVQTQDKDGFPITVCAKCQQVIS